MSRTAREEELGRIVRKAWSEAVFDVFPNAPAAWGKEWNAIAEAWKEVNTRVGLAVEDYVLGKFLKEVEEEATNLYNEVGRTHDGR